MNLAALPDDPTRTADYGYFPGEDDREDDSDVERVSETEAFETVLGCLSGQLPYAYGEAAEYWCEILNDRVCEPEDFRIACMSILGRGGDTPSATRHLQRDLQRFIHEHACGLLEKLA